MEMKGRVIMWQMWQLYHSCLQIKLPVQMYTYVQDFLF